MAQGCPGAGEDRHTSNQLPKPEPRQRVSARFVVRPSIVTRDSTVTGEDPSSSEHQPSQGSLGFRPGVSLESAAEREKS